ncbi:MAG: methyltransferase domain-containing protein [Candidatus Riflebacteria bacterium]|nr:methyltransferase domain-containing protein [Candidatus Riflebacteria bacterium]
MHESSYRHMARLVDRHLEPGRPLSILDVGSLDLNGSYRPLFDRPGWVYRGLDLTAGPNVDLVVESAHCWPLPSGGLDLVVSGQTFEHVELFWLTWLEMVRVLRAGGLIFLIAPSRGPQHRHPVDCWRFYPDGFRALARYGGVELVEVHTDADLDPEPASSEWGDTVGVFRKPLVGRARALRRALAERLQRWVLGGYREQ